MYQKVIIIGRLGRDPEMRYTPSGVPVTTFSVATSRTWKNAEGEQQEKTTWFRVTAWQRLAETCNEYLSKGRQVMVEGEIEASAWIGNDGKERANLELRARTVKVLGSRSDQGGGSYGPPAASAGETAGAPSDEDEIPF